VVDFYCLFYYFYTSGNIEISRVVGWKRWKNISKTNDPNNNLVAVETNFVEKTMQVSSNIIDIPTVPHEQKKVGQGRTYAS